MSTRESRRVSVTPLRDAFLRSGLSASEVCHRLEWYWRDGTPDTTRLLRALGIKPSASRGYRKCARWISASRALLIADALNLDPWEVGL